MYEYIRSVCNDDIMSSISHACLPIIVQLPLSIVYCLAHAVIYCKQMRYDNVIISHECDS